MATPSSWKVPSRLLPDAEERDLWVVDGAFTTAPPSGPIEALPGRFALPGLVDAHAHLSMNHGAPPLDASGVAERLDAWGTDGILVVRDIGAPPGSVTLDVPPAPTRPRLIAAGRWHAPKDRFFPEYHDPVEADDLRPAALAEVARGALWVKVIGDWRDGSPNYDPAVLREMIEAVHAAGARVAVHTQWEGVRDIVAAGVDSVEHGCLLDEETLRVMAERGVAWTPTITPFTGAIPDDATPAARERHDRWLANYRTMLPRAVTLGVTVLTGTDTAGTLSDEIGHLIEFGVSPRDALAGASTRAREFLGLGSFEDGSPADVVTYDADPRDDPEIVSHPVAIVLRGRRIR